MSSLFRFVTVLVLMIVSAGSALATVEPTVPAPTPTPEIVSRDVACAVAVAQLHSSDLVYTDDQVGRYTGCARSDSDRWVWPLRRDEDRLSDPIRFTEAETAAVLDTRVALEREVGGFVGTIGQQSDPFTVGGAGSMLASLMQFTKNSCSTGNGLWGFERGAPGAYSVMETYTGFFAATVNQVDYPTLTAFAIWWINQRASARPAAVDAMNPMARAAFDEVMAWQRFPWPFEMQSEYQQASFYRWLLDSGRVG